MIACQPPPVSSSSNWKGGHHAQCAEIVESWLIEEVYITSESLSTSSESSANLRLIIDSGASAHMLGSDFHPYLSNWRKGPLRTIRLADGRLYHSDYIADLSFSIPTTHGLHRVKVTDVIYIPDFPKGLASIPALARRGIKVSFVNDLCHIETPSVTLEIMRDSFNNLFHIPTNLPRPASSVPTIGNECEDDANLDEQVPVHELSLIQRKLRVLHSKLGHQSLRSIRHAVAAGHLTGVSISDLGHSLDYCDACRAAKLRAHSTTSTFSDSIVTQPFEMVHGDYGGKYHPTWNGKNGFSLYVDQFSGWIEGCLVSRKNLVCQHFQDVVKNVKTYGYVVQGLQTDSMKEYFEKKEFITWLTNSGIRQQASAPYAQYQNGYAEVTMQNVANAIRCHIFESGLPHSYWGDAFEYVIFTWNRTPCPNCGDITPYEVIMKKVPDLNFLHPFGCAATAIHHNESLPKFAPRGRQAIFLGYDILLKAYKLLCLDDRTIIFRAPRDVTFEDHLFPLHASIDKENYRKLFQTSSHMDNDQTTDYLDFDIPDPSSPINRGGVEAESSKDDPLILDPPTPIMSPSLSSSPSTPPLVPPILQGEHHEESAEPEDMHSRPIWERIQNDPNGPSKFLQSIPHDLPRLRSQSATTAKLAEEVNLTEDITHDQLDHVLLSEQNRIDIVTPKSYQQAVALPEKENWIHAMDKEMTSIHEAKTYVLVSPNTVPSHIHVAMPIWSFRVKFDGTFKARLCFPGHRQQFGVDYFQTESPVAKFSTFRMFTTIATHLGQKIHHFDIPNAFLNGDLSETVYMKQPPGYIDKDNPDFVCLLRKALYGLKQASLAWYIKLDDVLTSLGLHKHDSDPCLYYHFDSKSSEWAMVLIYVDDNAITGTDSLRNKIIEALVREFRAKDLGVASRYIGTSIETLPDGLLLHQKKDIEETLHRFKLSNVTPLKTPFNDKSHNDITNSQPFDETKYRSAIGTLMWYALSTRPDILFAVTSLAQYQANPTKLAWEALTRIFRYLKGTLSYGIFIPFKCEKGTTSFLLRPYSDASYADPVLGLHSGSGIIFFLNDVPIHWISRKQCLITLSSTEAEIVAASLCAQELLWITQLLQPLVQIKLPISLHIDNLSLKYIAETILVSHRTKHLNIRYLFIKQLIEEHPVILKWIPSQENLADVLTKYVPSIGNFVTLVSQILRTCH